MAFALYSDETSRIGYSRETTFGTAIADGGAFQELFCPKGVFINPGVKKTDLDLNRASRIQHLDDIIADTFTGPPSLTIPELICSKDIAADLLYAVFQNRTSQGAATAYQKVYNFGASQPDFTANAGMFFTLGWRGPVTAKHIKVASCIVKKLTIDFDKSGDGEKTLVHFKNVEIIGKKLSQGSTFSGTWTAQGSTRFNAHAFTYTDITASNTVMSWQKFALTIDNGAVPQDRDSDGTPRTYFLNPPKLGAILVEATHWYNAETTGTPRDVLAGLIANTQINAKLSTGNTGSDGFFDLNFKAVIAPDSLPAADNRQMMQTVKWIGGNAGSSTTDGLTVTIADSVSQA